ncbi:MAG: ABC transporter permease [Acidobacteria bacterium]|nr:ABC transporter permease [Acidobacteriota bacterium]MBV9476092.1 ABC transporter permease [Acidobacteriota bacterium]
MNKMIAVLKREYLQAVRKKMFIIMTFAFPFLMGAMITLPGLMVSRGLGTKRIAVLDGTGSLRDAFNRPNEQPKKDAKDEARAALSGRRQMEIPSELDIEYVDQQNIADVQQAADPYLKSLRAEGKNAHYDGVLVIPRDAMTSDDAKLTYYSRSATDLVTQERLGRLANKVIQRHRLAANGINIETVEKLTTDVPVESVQISRSGEQKKGGDMNFMLAFVFAALLLLPSFIYGNDIMRGIVQEKTERVVEVLISSMKPFELLTGKILGVASVGLTQISVWIAMLAIAGAYGVAAASMAGINVAQFLRPIVFVYFFVFFILAYLTYVCVYAIAGAISNSEKEAQQFVAPISLVMMAPWFMMFPIIMNPDSKLAVAFSLMPVFGPITMFVRTLVSEPPLWHIAVSIAVSLVTIGVFFWTTGKIFRVGILSYGKRPTIPELWRWMKVA